MERSPLYISPGYVAGPGELVVLFAGCLVMLGLMFLMLNDVIDVPPVPQELVLQRAHVTQPLDSSRSTAYLYIKVGVVRMVMITLLGCLMMMLRV